MTIIRTLWCSEVTHLLEELDELRIHNLTAHSVESDVQHGDASGILETSRRLQQV